MLEVWLIVHIAKWSQLLAVWQLWSIIGKHVCPSPVNPGIQTQLATRLFSTHIESGGHNTLRQVNSFSQICPFPVKPGLHWQE